MEKRPYLSQQEIQSLQRVSKPSSYGSGGFRPDDPQLFRDISYYLNGGKQFGNKELPKGRKTEEESARLMAKRVYYEYISEVIGSEHADVVKDLSGEVTRYRVNRGNTTVSFNMQNRLLEVKTIVPSHGKGVEGRINYAYRIFRNDVTFEEREDLWKPSRKTCVVEGGTVRGKTTRQDELIERLHAAEADIRYALHLDQNK